MSVKRKRHNLDESLLRRAKKVLGAATGTDAIHEALRAVPIGEHRAARYLPPDGYFASRPTARSAGSDMTSSMRTASPSRSSGAKRRYANHRSKSSTSSPRML